MIKKFLKAHILLFNLFFTFLVFSFFCASNIYASPHILKFEGIPSSMAQKIKQEFPFVFQREVTLAEADQVLKYLMSSQLFSNIEIRERSYRADENKASEYVLVAGLLRTIKDITITGNKQFTKEHILQKLKIEKSQIFERKELLASADELQTEYAEEGYLNPQIDIDFETPTDSDIIVHIQINEGEPSQITAIQFDCPNPEVIFKAKKLTKPLLNKRLSQTGLRDFENELKDFLGRNRYLRSKLSSPSLAFNQTRTKVKINYVIENPTSYEFLIDGNHFFSESNLIGYMELEKVVGATTSFAPDLSDRLRKAYLNAGFAHAQVEYKEKKFEKIFKEQIRFKITEGPRVRMEKFAIEGNYSQDPNFYSQYMRQNSSETLSLGYYNRKDLETAQKNLISELQNQGFLQAKITSSRTEFSKNKEYANTFVYLEEGPQTRIQNIKFKGNLQISSAELQAQLDIQAGSALQQDQLLKNIKKIKDYYKSKGFLEMRLVNEDDTLVQFNDNNSLSSIQFVIQEGPLIRVAGIEIQGLNQTKKYIVERELNFKVGDILTPQLIDESIYQLQKLQLFSSVQVKTIEEYTNISDRQVLISLSEYNPGLFNAGIGLNNEYKDLTYRGYIGIGHKNLGGNGRGISGRVDVWFPTNPEINYLENRLTLGYLEPWILGGRNYGRVNLIRQEKYSNQVNNLSIIEERRTADFLIERELTRHLKLTFYTYEFSRIKDFYRYPEQLASGVDAVTLAVDVAKIGPQFEIDYRDDIFNPTQGTYIKSQFFYSDPMLGSSNDNRNLVQFFKTEHSITHYSHILKSNRHIFVQQVRSGYLANLSSETHAGVPSTEAFSLGGASTIRGFDVTEKIPNVYDLGPRVSDYSSFKYLNDTYYFLIKTEFRFPLYKDFGGALFYDAGGVFVPQAGADVPDHYRDSLGFGLRINTPVGPVNMDIAFKLNRRSRRSGSTTSQTESPFAFHFTVGNF